MSELAQLHMIRMEALKLAVREHSAYLVAGRTFIPTVEELAKKYENYIRMGTWT